MHGDNASGNSLNLVIIRPGETIFEGPIVPDFCKKPEPIDLEYKFKVGCFAAMHWILFGSSFMILLSARFDDHSQAQRN